jgi:L-seryl-tRNA(Ser) seleniumtransferase
MAANPRRQLPSVDALLGQADDLTARHGRSPTVAALRAALAEARAAGESRPPELLLARAAELLERPPSLRPVLNATGVIVHTNLGRAPLAPAALDRVRAVAAGYSNLEYDLAAGARGSRHTHLGGILAELTGAETGMAVNNNAAAVLLCLAALAEGREVVISRGELIEIGDGFRIPDILSQSGARLVEVGTTNRTSLRDYEAAIGPDTAALVRVHQSNFRMVGFTASPRLDELAGLAAKHGVPLVDDLGSGQLLDLPDLADEPTARSSIEAGATVVCFSGDKLLGGPQAGVIVGTTGAVERIRRHPLARAMRIDKLSLAALEATLELSRDPQRALREIPVVAAAAESAEAVRERAERLADRLGGTVVASVARVGGGAVPLLELPSFACALDGGDALHAALRASDPPVVGVVREGRVLLDCRTLTDDQCLLISL